VIPALGYTTSPTDPRTTAETILRAIHTKWVDGCDLVHVHNPLLAKNRSFLDVLGILQQQQMTLFLQVHDFAEDGRPLSYSRQAYIPDCHYGVLNSRDYGILLQSGLKTQGLHKIPNAVDPLDIEETAAISNRVLYPVRAIRRKNIGEAILLSLFFRQGETLAISRPPNSKADMSSYADWKRYVKENNLPVEFEVGLQEDFETLVNTSKYLLTTSITEGFGFSFLEPWVAGKMLWGRRLPDICSDFITNDIRLDHLYDRLRVPLDWIGKKVFHDKWRTAVANCAALFHAAIDPASIEDALADVTREELVDFGLLDEHFQRQVISRVLSGRQHAEELITANACLKQIGTLSTEEALVAHNRKAVLDNYNSKDYGETLLTTYSHVIRKKVSQQIDKKRLLSHFFDLKRFSLLKWADYRP
ncbi:MAG: hypothetical protein V3S89_12630, partial [Desulfobacterales bacterium]